MMSDRKRQIRLITFISVLIIVANLILGAVLIRNSKEIMKTLMHNRMLDISNTSADMLDGDVLRDLKKEDKGTPGYQAINDTLAVFQENIDLRYIYCVRKIDEDRYVFTVDPAIEDPGEFGEPVVATEALTRAFEGVAAVDDEPYTDAWGRFYSSYSPVFDSSGEVAGVVAVDFEADWYDEQIGRIARSILIYTLVAVGLGVSLVLVATFRQRAQIRSITGELIELWEDVDELVSEIDPGAVQDHAHLKSTDDIREIGKRIHEVKDGLHEYSVKVHSQANSMITALSSDYHSVYYIDLDADEGICYQSHTKLENGLKQGEHFKYTGVIREYADKYVTESFRDAFLEFTDPDNVRKELEKERLISLLYLVKRRDIETYEMLRMAGVRHPEDRDDGIVHAIGMGFTDVDAQTRETLSQSQALNDALALAESANNAKTAFLSNMSHEIRTPMNAIIGLDRIALEEEGIPDTTREYLEKIGTAADHLLKIINDILDMSRIEAGRMVVNDEVFSLPVLLDQIDIMIGGQCRDKGLDWELVIRGDTGEYFYGDDMKLKQVFINILGNSVKFTPQGGKVTFEISRIRHIDERSVLRFVMSDNGIGMSEDYLPRLFEPFSQEDMTTKTKYGSTGLGMSITKSLVEMMNGEIKVESKKDEGTVFTVTVTLKDSAGDTYIPVSEKEDSEAAKEETSDQTIEVDLTGKRILLAEDIPINAEIVKMMLESAGMVVDHAENGRLAVEAYAVHPEGYYDAVLMDMRMPEMDGLEASAAIRAMDRADAASIPIIALTANAFNEDIQRSFQAGLNAHLSKPIDPDSLFSTLKKVIS